MSNIHNLLYVFKSSGDLQKMLYESWELGLLRAWYRYSPKLVVSFELRAGVGKRWQ